MDYADAAFQPRQLLMAGDTHGSLDQIKYLAGIAHDNGCDAIIVLGDFQLADSGYPESLTDEWPEAEKILASANLPLFFTDGNHEDYDYLKSVDAFGADHMTTLSPHIVYLPRGLIWEWNGFNFLAMGGA